jgi:hypothetical protein
MSNKKYEFTGETKEWRGHTLHRYCAFGMCVDNAVCDKQMDAEGNLTHKEEK